MNFSVSLARTRFSNGAAKVRIIFRLPNFFETIFKKSFQEDLCASLFKNSQPHQPPVFQMGVQRYDFLINFQIFPAKFCNFFDTSFSGKR